MSRSYRWSIALAAALALAAPLSAQRATAGDPASAPFAAALESVVVSLAPIPALEPVTVTETVADRPVTPAPMAMSRRQSVALMIVGGTGLVVGSLIDGDTGTIVMVGGAAVGLFGLFQFLR